MRFLLRLALPLMLLLAVAGQAAAHAMLERATPPVGSVVRSHRPTSACGSARRWSRRSRG